MKQCSFWLLMFAGLLLLMATGCASLLPTSRTTTRSQWTNYTQVDAAFARIIPFQTRTNDLKALGFAPSVSPNVHILTYVDIVHHFMSNPAITKKDLPKAVRDCIEAKEKSCAYEIDLNNTKDKRHGNVFLDIFGFKRRTTQTGWEFKGLVLVNDGLVVYKLSSGEPLISRETENIKPLGPFQELDGLLVHGVAVVQ